MLTCCNTARGRVACGLGGVLIAVLALACLWAFSPSVTASDDPLPPHKERVEPGKLPSCLPPPLPSPPKPETKVRLPSLPPVAGTAQAPLPPVDTPPTIRPVAGVAPVTPPPPQAQPLAETQDVKQLVAQLNAIRADRAKLDEKERQTIQTIKRKYQDQKRALEQLGRELRQLGINCDETAPDKAPVRRTGYESR